MTLNHFNLTDENVANDISILNDMPWLTSGNGCTNACVQNI